MGHHAGRYVVVLTDNAALRAALPLHLALPVEHDLELVVGAAAVLLDHVRADTDEDIRALLERADPARVVIISDRDIDADVGAVCRRPVSLADVAEAVERVASHVSTLAPVAVAPDDPVPAREAEVSLPAGTEITQPPTVDPPPDAAIAPAVVAARLEPTPAVVPHEEPPAGSEAVKVAHAISRAVSGLRSIAAVIETYPALASSGELVEAVATDWATAIKAEALGFWVRSSDDMLRCLGGIELTTTDRRRAVAWDHPLVAMARPEALLVADVMEDPGAVAGLPLSYCRSLMLLTADIGGKDVVMIAGGDEFRPDVIDRVESLIAEGRDALDFAFSLRDLLERVRI